MRIISGTHRGRTVIAPRNLPVRPTTDFAKEALFNILRHRFDLSSITALDLFCGTGNISYELASRGAQSILSVDANFGCVRFVNQTSDKFGFEQIRSLRADALKFLGQQRQTYDLIFADPPYDFEDTARISELVFEHQLLNPDGLLVVEHPKEVDLSSLPNFEEQRSYGKVQFSLFANP